MTNSKLDIEKELSALLNADTPEEELLNTYRKMKQEKEKKAEKSKVIKKQREKVIIEIINYLKYISDRELTKEEQNEIIKYINDVLDNCEKVAGAGPEPKATKRAWRNGKELSEKEADEIIDEFLNNWRFW